MIPIPADTWQAWNGLFYNNGYIALGNESAWQFASKKKSPSTSMKRKGSWK